MLIERGYSSSAAGLCFTCVNLTGLILTPFLSNYLDNNDKVSVFDVIMLFSMGFCLLYFINFFLDTKCLLLSIVFIVSNSLYVLLDPIVNSISSKVNQYGINIPYTGARALGSVSYGTMCAVFGFLSNRFSYISVIIGGIVFSLALFICGTIGNKQFKKIKETNSLVEEDNDRVSIKEFVKNNKNYLILCLCITGIFIGYTSVDNFILLVTTNVGGTNQDMGCLLAYKAALEGIAISSFPLVLKKVKLENTLYIAVVAFIIKQLVITLAPNVFWLYIGQTFQLISYSFLTPGIVAFVNKYLKKRERIRGISMYSMTVGIGSAVSSTTSGYILDLFGVRAMNIYALSITIISVIGFIITLRYREKHN